MREIGNLLGRTREQKGLSLVEVERATKIRRRYLEALERGDFVSLPGRVYALGYIRTYARYLGLDYEELGRQASTAWDGDSSGESRELVRAPGTTAYRPLETGAPAKLKLRKAVASILVIVILLVMVPLFLLRTWLAPVEKPPVGSRSAANREGLEGENKATW